MQPIIQTTAGDSAPDETLYLVREDGTVVVLTNAQSVKLIIIDPVTGLHTNDATNDCTIIDAPNGVVVYSWTAGGTDCPDEGIYRAYVRVTYNDNSQETVRIRIEAGEKP